MDSNLDTRPPHPNNSSKSWKAAIISWFLIALVLAVVGYFLNEALFYIPGVVWIVVVVFFLAYRFYKWLDKSGSNSSDE